MTGPGGIIRRAVSFIFDPVPRQDRRPKRSADFVVHPAEPFDWSGLHPDVLEAKHPRSSPARLRPYNWQVEHAWPVEGWVLS